MTTKEFKTWMTVNYKTGQFKLMKRRPTKIGPSEIPIDMKLNIVIPETPVIHAHGEVEISETKVKEMMLEALEE